MLAAHIDLSMSLPQPHALLLMHMEPWRCSPPPLGQPGWIFLTRVGDLDPGAAAGLRALLTTLQTLDSGSVPAPHPLVTLARLAFANGPIPGFANGPAPAFAVPFVGCTADYSIINPSDFSVEVDGVGLNTPFRRPNDTMYPLIDICKGAATVPGGVCTTSSAVLGVMTPRCPQYDVSVTLDPASHSRDHLQALQPPRGCSDVIGPHQRREGTLSMFSTASETYTIVPELTYRDATGPYIARYPALHDSIIFTSSADHFVCYQLDGDSLVPDTPPHEICV